MWHKLLLLLHVRNEFDWAPGSLGPEVPHPYIGHATLQCCEHCGGGRLNAIHKPPYDPRRTAEILGGRWSDNQVGPVESAKQRAFIEREAGRAKPGHLHMDSTGLHWVEGGIEEGRER